MRRRAQSDHDRVMTAIELLDPDASADREAWWELVETARADLLPQFPPIGRQQAASWLYPDIGGRRETWVQRDSAGLMGAVSLDLWPNENAHLAFANPLVRPSARRQGVGSELYAHAHERAREEHRRSVNTFAMDDEAMQEFAKMVGATQSEQILQLVQPLDVDTRSRAEQLLQEAEAASEGFTLVRWVGRCPDEYVDGYIHAVSGMDDAPRPDSLDMAANRLTPEQLNMRQALQTQIGYRNYVICAREQLTGEFVGVTNVLAFDGQQAEQGDTTVLDGHRGHRLGLRLKSAMVLWLLDAEPQLTHVVTGNANNNDYMLRVNRALGYEVSSQFGVWSRPID